MDLDYDVAAASGGAVSHISRQAPRPARSNTGATLRRLRMMARDRGRRQADGGTLRGVPAL